MAYGTPLYYMRQNTADIASFSQDLLLPEPVLPALRLDWNVRCHLHSCLQLKLTTACSAISLNVVTPVDCQSLYTFNQVSHTLDPQYR